MNKMDTERRAAILSALVEGNSIASICRMFTVNKVTVLRLLSDAGTLAADFHDLTVRNLETKRIQMDEIWAFIGAKDQNATPEKKVALKWGDSWTWTAIDADSKLMIAWHIGPRDGYSAFEIMKDVADRLKDRVQITTDGLHAYVSAAGAAFNCEVDFAQIIKLYGLDQSQGRYSPPKCIGIEIKPKIGNPDPMHISTSFVERQNLTMRMSMRRFTRLTNGFSKRAENHAHSIALHFFHYNFIRRHQTIKTTPAMMANVTNKQWTMVDFVKLIEREERLLGGRLTDYKPAKPAARTVN